MAAQQESAMLDLTIHSNLQGVRRGLDRVSTTLANNGYSKDLRGSVEILLAEIMNNIVKHAYGGAEIGRITVKVSSGDGGLFFKVTDEGIPLPESAVQLVEFDFINTPVQDLPEGGFGWQLIHQIACGLDYERAGERNILTFMVPSLRGAEQLSFQERVRLQNQAGG